MPNYISTGPEWYTVSTTEQANVEAGTITKASLITATSPRKKKD